MRRYLGLPDDLQVPRDTGAWVAGDGMGCAGTAYLPDLDRKPRGWTPDWPEGADDNSGPTQDRGGSSSRPFKRMTIIKELRLKRGLEPRKLAEAAGISVEGYYDLECIDDERYAAPSVRQIALLARELGVKPSALYEGSSDRTISMDGLASFRSIFDKPASR